MQFDVKRQTDYEFYFWNFEDEGKESKFSGDVVSVGLSKTFEAMCSTLKDFICVYLFRCSKCKKRDSGPLEKCSHTSNSSPKVRLRKFKKKSNSYDLFSSEMGSNRTGEINYKIYSEDKEMLMKSKTNKDCASAERHGKDTSSRKTRQSSQTPEYVKRTAKLFETVKISEEVEMKNGLSRNFEQNESSYSTEERRTEKETVKISLDSLDGDFNKKPSYLGVSCSNSGYRNVINYDSKLREGFWANNQRESLVLTSSRLRESSPMRRDFDFKTHNGTEGESIKITRNIPIEIEGSIPVNGVSKPEKFVNISTSTKTISTFRNSKDIKEEELGKNMNGLRDFDRKSNGEGKVNLKQILNTKNDEPFRKGYSNLGFSPKILKSPEKNCNSFLKSISSFENNCKKSQSGVSSSYTKSGQTISDSKNSIQQRIERLYGPGALAQGFYQKMKFFDKPEDYSSDGEIPVMPNTKLQTSINNGSPVNGNALPNTTSEVAPTVQRPNGHVAEEPDIIEETEKNGHYFLKLLKKETDRLESLASFAESELENGENLPEEISGKLRAASGKARLLVCQKLHQFEGLCHKNLNEKPDERFPTTSEDLAGFWDMVMLQIKQVYGVFDEIEELRKNNWKVPAAAKEMTTTTTNGQTPSAKTTPKKSTPNSTITEKQSQKSEAAKKAREEGRKKMLEDRRKKMKELKENKIINGDAEVEIFAK